MEKKKGKKIYRYIIIDKKLKTCFEYLQNFNKMGERDRKNNNKKE